MDSVIPRAQTKLKKAFTPASMVGRSWANADEIRASSGDGFIGSVEAMIGLDTATREHVLGFDDGGVLNEARSRIVIAVYKKGG
jgi:hypothetical protein